MHARNFISEYERDEYEDTLFPYYFAKKRHRIKYLMSKFDEIEEKIENSKGISREELIKELQSLGVDYKLVAKYIKEMVDQNQDLRVKRDSLKLVMRLNRIAEIFENPSHVTINQYQTNYVTVDDLAKLKSEGAFNKQLPEATTKFIEVKENKDGEQKVLDTVGDQEAGVIAQGVESTDEQSDTDCEVEKCG